MNTMSRFFRAMIRGREAAAKARVRSSLMSLGPEWVERQGYSYELLRGGVKNWPWRHMPDRLTEEKEFKRTINELKRFSDRELNDPGITRSGIETAVRPGLHEENIALNQEDVAA